MRIISEYDSDLNVTFLFLSAQPKNCAPRYSTYYAHTDIEDLDLLTVRDVTPVTDNVSPELLNGALIAAIKHLDWVTGV